jgi:hypothetical protein
MSETSMAPPSTSKLELRTAYGPVYRDVLNIPPRDCTAEEIPVIDLTPLYSSNLEDRKTLASEIRATAVNTGFFYIKNHGISDKIIADAKTQLLALVTHLPVLRTLTKLGSIASLDNL